MAQRSSRGRPRAARGRGLVDVRNAAWPAPVLGLPSRPFAHSPDGPMGVTFDGKWFTGTSADWGVALRGYDFVSRPGMGPRGASMTGRSFQYVLQHPSSISGAPGV